MPLSTTERAAGHRSAVLPSIAAWQGAFRVLAATNDAVEDQAVARELDHLPGPVVDEPLRSVLYAVRPTAVANHPVRRILRLLNVSPAVSQVRHSKYRQRAAMDTSRRGESP